MSQKLTIDLNGLGAEPEDETPSDPMKLELRQNPIDDLMSSALEHGDEGITLEFRTEKEAHAMRFRIYHRRKRLSKMGITSFDDLCVRVDKNHLILSRYPEFKIL